MQFTKMSGTGNDFIMVNNIQGQYAHDWSAMAKRYCHRQNGIGADGLIVLEPAASADFTMRIFNADGSEAEMCGNGARCAAAFAVAQGVALSPMRFATLAGIIAARVEEDGPVAIALTPPHSMRESVAVAIGAENYRLAFVDTGVPHAVLFTDKLDDMPVDSLGRAIRRHSVFAPAGTNANFVQALSAGHIRVRTYERGVEAETLACGTGATASALMSYALGKVTQKPVAVSMPGGELKIDFTYADGQFSDVWLIGAVQTVFQGVTA